MRILRFFKKSLKLIRVFNKKFQKNGFFGFFRKAFKNQKKEEI